MFRYALLGVGLLVAAGIAGYRSDDQPKRDAIAFTEERLGNVIRLYGSRISYYLGKLQAYLRYRGIEYEILPMIDHAEKIKAGAGALQGPVVELEDGRWLSDTTPMLAWFESQREGATIYPEDPGMRFVALLLEDHADEWLWRPSMHYRWSYPQDRDHASSILCDEMMGSSSAPRSTKKDIVVGRQFGGFVERDGVSAATRAHVEQTAMAAFDGLDAVLAERCYLLGERPTIVDYGFMGPMLHHFTTSPFRPRPDSRGTDATSHATRVHVGGADVGGAP